jgi:AraC-like DNA-binding protein
MHANIYDALARSPLLRGFKSAFRDATGLSLALARSGKCSPHTRSRRANGFCAVMAADAGACIACRDVKRELQRRLDLKLASQRVCCFASMIELAVPVVVGGCHAATLHAGEVFREKPSSAQFERLVRRLRAGGMRTRVRELRQLYFRTPVLSERQLRGATRLLGLFAVELAEWGNRAILQSQGGEPPCVSQVKSFVAAHARECVTTRQAACHVHLSHHYFSKIFRKATGMTFTEFVARVRVENAKKLLQNPRLRVTEVSDAAGFNSISQFNRVFRRFAGLAPKAYRASLRATG